MKKVVIILIIIVSLTSCNNGQDTLPVRGFCISAPSPDKTDAFITFINEELVTRNVNTLVIMVNYGYQYKTHPEIANVNGLSETDIKKIVTVCRDNNIHLIPLVNLLGHQSWKGRTGKLLTAYPEFDETPDIIMPLNYEWPNTDSLYCKSYCPLHPDVHKIVFDLVDEICDVFEADAFHAGMDEVFYIGHKSCLRCTGKNKAELYAGEVNQIRDHLALKKRKLWIWGDRLIDGRKTGLGIWEASQNSTWPAVDMISKDITICDWHYTMATKTPVYFAEKGFSVVTCPWNNPKSAVKQTRDMRRFRKKAKPELENKYCGMMQTVWSDPNKFLIDFYSKYSKDSNTEANCFRALYNELNKANEYVSSILHKQ